jgi:hypothetical protein
MKTTWVCLACGKVSEDRYGKINTTPGWDESCFLNSVLAKEDHLVLKEGRVVKIEDGGIIEMKLFKWQKKILSKIQSYTNRQLLDETLVLASGDSYEGEFTNRGGWEFEESKKELEKRLGDWLNEM